jgi:membrane-associated phospholipid phosphatase
MFTRKEVTLLGVIAMAALLSYFTRLDYSVAEALSTNASHGTSLFFSSQYYVMFIFTGIIVVFLKRKKAAAALAISIVLIFLMQSVITHIAPRARPPQSMLVEDPLMKAIQWSGASSSFFSGHTASVVAVCTVLMQLEVYPVTAFLLAVPIMTSRITLVHHYISDVLGGIIFGYVTAKAAYVWMMGKRG